MAIRKIKMLFINEIVQFGHNFLCENQRWSYLVYFIHSCNSLRIVTPVKAAFQVFLSVNDKKKE